MRNFLLGVIVGASATAWYTQMHGRFTIDRQFGQMQDRANAVLNESRRILEETRRELSAALEAGRHTIQRTDRPLNPSPGDVGSSEPGQEISPRRVSEVVDALVVGAGPGGATAAARLAEEGLNVILLERASFPRDKPCGGGLSAKAYRLLDVDVTDLVLARPSRVRLTSPGATTVELASRAGAIWMVRRPDFDQRLVDHAVSRGARLQTNVVVRAVHPAPADGLALVETDRGSYRARAVVGADGADSVVARTAGLRTHRDRQYTLALEIEAPRPRNAPDDAALIDFALPRGYAWIFPKGAMANVGVGSDDRAQFRLLRQHLAHFIQRHGLVFAGEPRAVGHKIPVWRGSEPLHRANVLLVGDAAGVADPFFGEGIAYAIQTGRFAALAVARYCAGDWPDLAGYTRSVQTVLGRDLLFWSILGRVVYRAPGLAINLLAMSRRFQSLADAAISGDKSFSKAWRREPAATCG